MEMKSAFATTMRALIEFRSAMGFSPTTYECRFRRFDDYCRSVHPGKAELTRDIVFGWLAWEQDRNRPGSMRGDATAMRTLANYIRAFGGNAYVLPYRVHSIRSRYVPHVLSDGELASLFRRIDERASKCAGNVSVQGAYSVLFRLAYTCGLRPQEVRAVRIRDVNPDNRTIFLRETKHHSERIIGLSDDMSSLLRTYMRRQSKAVPSGEFLFSTHEGASLGSGVICDFFRNCWRTCDINVGKKDIPRVRVYDLRHRFASETLQRWTDEGRDLYALLPVLRAYMGHSEISCTLYYVHLLPENVMKSARIDWSRLNAIIPEE